MIVKWRPNSINYVIYEFDTDSLELRRFEERFKSTRTTTLKEMLDLTIGTKHKFYLGNKLFLPRIGKIVSIEPSPAKTSELAKVLAEAHALRKRTKSFYSKDLHSPEQEEEALKEIKNLNAKDRPVKEYNDLIISSNMVYVFVGSLMNMGEYS